MTNLELADLCSLDNEVSQLFSPSEDDDPQDFGSKGVSLFLSSAANYVVCRSSSYYCGWK